MSDTKHTPGPWAVDDHDHGVEVFRAQPMPGGGRGEGVCAVYGWGGMRDADARLIAAAPELLEALERMERHARDFAECPFCHLPPEIGCATDCPLTAARAAIEKARGGR